MIKSIIAALALTMPAFAQNLPIVTPDPALASMETHPSLTLGRRAETLRAARPVARTLVIAPSARSAMEQIARWQPGAYWPVLIDDGSERAASDIARFVRAFEPGAIRIAPGTQDTAPSQGELDDALRSAWAVPEGGTLTDAFARSKWTPPGVVVTDADHAPSIAALALAAGRGQPIVWTDVPKGSGNSIMSGADRDALLRSIGEGVRALPHGWDAIGDDIDAITLCLSLHTKVRTKKNGPVLALTDVVGRTPAGERWAYASLIRESAPASLYDAMCALFIIDPGPFWVFDGYERDFAPPYACSRAATFVRNAGVDLRIVLPPTNLPDAWRARTRVPLDAGMVHVNSSGESTRFQLGAHAKRCYGSDVPTLRRPAIVHFIHSFSAQAPASGDTIAARWMDEGAHAYLGSVDEPLLGAFAPPDGYLSRMLAGGAFGASVRRDDIGPWRLQVFGDPLVTISKAVPPKPRAPIDFSAMPTLQDALGEAAADRDLARTLRILIMLGRTEQATEILKAALEEGADQGMTVGVESAIYGTQLAELRADADLMLSTARRLPSDTWDDPRYSARLWRTLRHTLRDPETDEAAVGLLLRAKRPESVADDAEALLPALTRLYSRERVDSFLRELQSIARFNADKARIGRMIGG